MTKVNIKHSTERQILHVSVIGPASVSN